MKNYDEMARDVLRRVEENKQVQQKKRKQLKQVLVPVVSLCLVALIGVGVWQGGWLFGDGITASNDQYEDNTAVGGDVAAEQETAKTTGQTAKKTTAATQAVQGTAPKAASAVGSVLLSVNPEIEIQYDKEGLVVALIGKNADGKAVVAKCTEFKGKTVEEITEVLVQLIYDGGYLNNKVEGNDKNVVVKMEKDSKEPKKDFLKGAVNGANRAIQKHKGKSRAMKIEQKELDKEGMIGLEKAKELLFAQLGLNEATFTNKEYEIKRNGCYEFEFTVNGIEYEFKVDCYTGKVIKSEIEVDDDDDKKGHHGNKFDDDDDRYDDDRYDDDDDDDDRYDDDRYDDDDDDDRYDDDRYDDDDDDDRYDDDDDDDDDDKKGYGRPYQKTSGTRGTGTKGTKPATKATAKAAA